MKRILFVCTGNICRSPTAEGVLRKKLHAQSLTHLAHIDSAGIADYHRGHHPDLRSQEAALRRGYDLHQQTARQFLIKDYDDFDLIIGMAHEHVEALISNKPEKANGEIKLFLDYLPAHQGDDVPDPYYDSKHGFDMVLDLIEQGCDHFIDQLKRPDE